ncbi:MAG TPA: ABC transporter substrate-binding protein [Bdellovibrionales bacterium]|nr:ABC transporter substrate-binding protein [Bdellovibrionales bacterium]
MKQKFGWMALALIGAGIFVGLMVVEKDKIRMKPVDELKVRITGSMTLPDPAKIDSTGDWYYLSHVSSGLVSYDSQKQKFAPLMVESLSTEENGVHRFQLLPGLKFHDGTPLTVKDVVWSIKRQLLLKSSTHFRLWDYVVGCEDLKSLDQECEGLKAVSDFEIEIKLKIRADSFFLQLASPETGIWAASDMNPQTGELKATKFSGAYFVKNIEAESALLLRNPHAVLSQKFPESPKSIRLVKVALPALNQALKDKKVDLAVRSYRPFGEESWSVHGVSVRSTTPSTIIYLYGTGTKSHKPVGRDFIESAWQNNKDERITPADTYLPFANKYGLTKEQFLKELPEKTAPVLRILAPEGFFAKEFLEQLQVAANDVGTTLKFHFGGPAEWFGAFRDESASEKYDYILSIYAASERYPSVQLRQITGSLPKAPIDLTDAEAPDLTEGRIQILRDYQKWLLRSLQAVPIFFNSTLFLHQNHLDIGEQPTSDAEIELWRVREKVGP